MALPTPQELALACHGTVSGRLPSLPHIRNLGRLGNVNLGRLGKR